MFLCNAILQCFAWSSTQTSGNVCKQTHRVKDQSWAGKGLYEETIREVLPHGYQGMEKEKWMLAKDIPIQVSATKDKIGLSFQNMTMVQGLKREATEKCIFSQLSMKSDSISSHPME